MQSHFTPCVDLRQIQRHNGDCPNAATSHVVTRGCHQPRCCSLSVLNSKVSRRHPFHRAALSTRAAALDQFQLAAAGAPLPIATVLGIVGAVAALILALKRVYDTPSRTYSGNVGDEYDAWAEEGILEYYWGEHIHLGYYSEEERRRGYKKKDFKKAKYDFIAEMLRWTGVKNPKRILDVGCGFGGTSRYLAAAFPDAEVIGITLSPKQVEKGTLLAEQRGLTNVKLMVMDALNMTFEPDMFDLVWGCESGEHMPDKKRYVEQMTRVLAPGGTLAIATWCQREETPENPLSEKDKADLQFLYDEWAHPFFISYEHYGRLLQGTGAFSQIVTDDWTQETLPSWRHSNWVGVWDPWPVVFKFNPKLWYKVTREIVTIERFHQAFARGLCTYGMIKGVKQQMSTVQQGQVLQAVQA